MDIASQQHNATTCLENGFSVEEQSIDTLEMKKAARV